MQAEQLIMLQKNSDGACFLYHTASKSESQTSGEKYCLLFSDERPCSSRQDTVLLMRVGRDFFRNVLERLVFMSADKGLAGAETKFGV